MLIFSLLHNTRYFDISIQFHFIVLKSSLYQNADALDDMFKHDIGRDLQEGNYDL
jgi:hypothetical protein